MATEIITDNSTGGTHSGILDSYINNNAATTNYGTGSTLEVVNDGFSYANQKRAQLRIPLRSVLNGATISAVRLKLYRVDGGGSGWTVDVHELLRDWVEAEVTYNNYSTGNAWATAGGTGTGDIAASAAASVVIDGGSGAYIEWSGSGLVSLLQAKATANASYVDLFVKCQSPTSGPSFYAVFTSSEGTDGQRPILEIDYTPGGDTTAPNITGPVYTRLTQGRLTS